MTLDEQILSFQQVAKVFDINIVEFHHFPINNDEAELAIILEDMVSAVKLGEFIQKTGSFEGAEIEQHSGLYKLTTRIVATYN